MTTKAKTRTAPAAAGINPKLAALAAKMDSEKAKYRHIIATMDASHERDGITFPILDRICALEERAAKVVGTNLEDLKLKSLFACFDSVHFDPDESIIRDLLAMGAR